jgi:hypothetical protein
MPSARRLMETIFWERKGVVMVKFMQKGDHTDVISVLRNTKRTAYVLSE